MIGYTLIDGPFSRQIKKESKRPGKRGVQVSFFE